MPTTAICPSCRGPLRIPDELVGQRVRCPTCQSVFEAAADAPPPAAPPPEPERPLWKDLQLELDKPDPDEPQKEPDPGPEPEPPPPPPAPRKPGPVGAVELKLSIDDEPAPAPRSPAPPAPPRRPEAPPPRRPEPPPGPRRDDYPPGRYDEDEDEDYRGARRPYMRRRDTEPHRGPLILTLGIISLASLVLNLCYFLGALIGLPLGITAWVLGQKDLAKIKAQQMDDEGLGMTQAGWICGMIGTILNTLVLLSCGGFVAYLLYQMSMVQSGPPKPGFAAPPPMKANP